MQASLSIFYILYHSGILQVNNDLEPLQIHIIEGLTA
jgi:hypothetical protein